MGATERYKRGVQAGELAQVTPKSVVLKRAFPMKVLLIEDDDVLADILVKSLTGQNYVVDVAEDGPLGYEYATSSTYDLLLVDVGLPRLDGIRLCQQLRSSGCTVPILLMTAKDARGDRIRGLDAGADDYLIKPFDLEELQARARALVRRGDVAPSPVLEFGPLRLDPTACSVTYEGKPLALTPKEYSLLELFLRHPQRVFSRSAIVEHLWTFDDPPQEDSVKAHIKGLRHKLKRMGAEDWIENVYGLGYRLREGMAPASTRSTPAPTLEQKFDQAIDGLWERYRGLMDQRMAVLQQTAIALQTGALTDEQRQVAEQAAHKLAGVLGMFGLEEGTAIARTLESRLEAGIVTPAPLISLIEQLQGVMQSNANPSSAPPTHLPIPMPTGVHILAVDDDPIILAALRTLLQPWGVQLTELDDARRFWDVLHQTQPDLLILDVDMPHGNGIDLCREARSRLEWQSLPILFLTVKRDSATVHQVFAAGADDYIVKPIVNEELITRIGNRLERTRLLRSLTQRDPITGWQNQPSAQRQLEGWLQTRCHVSLLMVKIADLRQIQLHYGHGAAHQALYQCGRSLQTQGPPNASTGYWGDGEFVMGLDATLYPDGEGLLNQLLATLRRQICTTSQGERFQITPKGAMAVVPRDGKTVLELYRVLVQRVGS